MIKVLLRVTKKVISYSEKKKFNRQGSNDTQI